MRTIITTGITQKEDFDFSVNEILKKTFVAKNQGLTTYNYEIDNLTTKSFLVDLADQPTFSIDLFEGLVRSEVRFVHVVAHKFVESSLDTLETRLFDLTMGAEIVRTHQFQLSNSASISSDITISNVEVQDTTPAQKTKITVIIGLRND